MTPVESCIVHPSCRGKGQNEVREAERAQQQDEGKIIVRKQTTRTKQEHRSLHGGCEAEEGISTREIVARVEEYLIAKAAIPSTEAVFRICWRWGWRGSCKETHLDADCTTLQQQFWPRTRMWRVQHPLHVQHRQICKVTSA
jgi:hypothetical protein